MSQESSTNASEAPPPPPKSPKRWSVASVATLFGGSAPRSTSSGGGSSTGGVSPRSKGSSATGGSSKELIRDTSSRELRASRGGSGKGVAAHASSSSSSSIPASPLPKSPTPSSLNKYVEASKFEKGDPTASSEDRLRSSGSSRHKSTSKSSNSKRPLGDDPPPSPVSPSSDDVMDKLDSYLDERKMSSALHPRGSGGGGGGTVGGGGTSATLGHASLSSSLAPTDAAAIIPRHSSASADDASPSSGGDRTGDHKIARSTSDRAERSRLKASLLGTFLNAEPSSGGLGGTGDSNSDLLETRSVYTSMTKARKVKKKDIAKKDDSSLPTVKEELLSFLSTLPKTLDKDAKKEAKAAAAASSSSTVAAVGSEAPSSPDRGRRRKIGNTVEAIAVVEKRHRSRSRRARSKSRVRSSNREDGTRSSKEDTDLRRSRHDSAKDEMKRSRREDKNKDEVKKSRKEDRKEKEELKSSLRKSMRPEPDGKKLSKGESSRKLSKIESSRKLSKHDSTPNLENAPELQSSQGSLPSVDMSPHSALSSPRLIRVSRRRSNETEPHHHHSSKRPTEGPSPRRKSEIPSRRKSEVSTSSSRRTHKSERRKSTTPASVPEEDSPPSTPKKMNRHEELISPTASRAKRSSSRIRSSSRSRSSTTPSEMVIITKPSSSKKTSGRSKSVDPRRAQRERRESQPNGEATAAVRGRSRQAVEPSASAAMSKVPKSPGGGNRARSVSPVAAKDRYSAMLKTEDGNVKTRTHFTEIQASEKLERSPGAHEKAAVVPDPSTTLPAVPIMDGPQKKAGPAKDSTPFTPSRRMSAEDQVKPLGSDKIAATPTTDATDESLDAVTYDEEDIFTFFSWSSSRQDPHKIQKERMLLKQSIRETPLYRAFQHLNAT